MKPKITMIGAGSPGFSLAVGQEICASDLLKEATFVLMDVNKERLDASEKRIGEIVKKTKAPLKVSATCDRAEALDGCDFVITSCEKERFPFWIKDIEIPQRHGVYQLMGENGGPGGQIHAMRNITIFMDIVKDMRRLCPEAWIMNFTNPMSFICTYLIKYSKISAVGLCHQVHGSFGVVAEMLGFEPGEFQVISGGINHMNWLLDIRRRETGESFLDEFLSRVRKSIYWQKNHENIPQQKFTLEVLDLFGAYPIGYDDHIVEYMPFFYDHSDWPDKEYESKVSSLRTRLQYKDKLLNSDDPLAMMEGRQGEYPFPKDSGHPYYKEKACTIIEALLTGSPAYLDSTVTINKGAIDNLPFDGIVDVPVVVAGGGVKSVHIGELPLPCAELCRRQITIHELVVQAAMQGDRAIALQAMCLDPYVRSLSQARAILDDFLKEYSEELPQFST